MQRTVKIKLNPSLEERQSFFKLMEICTFIYNETVDFIFEKKSLDKKLIHKELYYKQKNQYIFPGALLQTTRDVAIGNVRQTKFKFKPKRSKLSSINYDCRTLKLRGNLLTLSTSDKRYREQLNFPQWCQNYVENGQCKSGKLVYDKKKNQFYIHLVFKIDDPQLKDNGLIIGFDRGLINLVTTSEGIIYDAKRVRKSQRKYLYLRKKLSSKGTRSAKRALKRLSGREKRFSRDINHCLSKELSSDKRVKTYVIEDLKGIRKSKGKGKKFNKNLSSWTFFQFETFLTYKCIANGISVVKVDPKYTSQMCHECGFVDKGNRNRDKFHCKKCGHTSHADVNAAQNIQRKFFAKLLMTGSKSMTRRKNENFSLTDEVCERKQAYVQDVAQSERC